MPASSSAQAHCANLSVSALEWNPNVPIISIGHAFVQRDRRKAARLADDARGVILLVDGDAPPAQARKSPGQTCSLRNLRASRLRQRPRYRARSSTSENAFLVDHGKVSLRIVRPVKDGAVAGRNPACTRHPLPKRQPWQACLPLGFSIPYFPTARTGIAAPLPARPHCADRCAQSGQKSMSAAVAAVFSGRMLSRAVRPLFGGKHRARRFAAFVSDYTHLRTYKRTLTRAMRTAAAWPARSDSMSHKECCDAGTKTGPISFPRHL